MGDGGHGRPRRPLRDHRHLKNLDGSAPAGRTGRVASACLAARARPDAWLGLCVRVVEPFERDGVSHPAHYLAAGWAPGEPRSRWPDAVVIGSPAAADALALLLARMPPDATLFLADRDAVDASLAARILLAADRNLEPSHRAGIEAFVADEDARVAARLAGSYTDRDGDFERFRERVLARPGSGS